MKRKLTITFEFDDAPWVDEETKEEHPTDAIAYAMDHVNRSVPYAAIDEFVEAKLDGEVLVDGNGYVSDEVKKREPQYRAYQREIVSRILTNRVLPTLTEQDIEKIAQRYQCQVKGIEQTEG